MIVKLKRGDITTLSFAFTIDSDTWTKKDNGSYIRTINKFKELFDVSPVYKEAYPDTSVALRKLESFDKEDLTDYYMELRHKLHNEHLELLDKKEQLSNGQRK